MNLIKVIFSFGLNRNSEPSVLLGQDGRPFFVKSFRHLVDSSTVDSFSDFSFLLDSSSFSIGTRNSGEPGQVAMENVVD